MSLLVAPFHHIPQGVHLDLEQHTLGFSVNGDFKGTAIQNLPADATFFPAICMYYKACMRLYTIKSNVLKGGSGFVCARHIGQEGIGQERQGQFPTISTQRSGLICHGNFDDIFAENDHFSILLDNLPVNTPSAAAIEAVCDVHCEFLTHRI
jgi:hypothetical protein